MTSDALAKRSPAPIAYIGLDESGSLSDDTTWFTLAAVVTADSDNVRNLIRRAAKHSGKHLRKRRSRFSDFKWSNSSERFRRDVLSRLARTEVDLFVLPVQKGGRRIEDTPENYAILVCELLRSCWTAYPNVAIAIDRHFTSQAQIAVLNTFVYRHWPATGVLSINHVDSQRDSLVQLADFVAGSVYAWHKRGDKSFQIVESKFRSVQVRDWPDVKGEWLRK